MKTVKQFVKFGITGVVNNVISLVVYYIVIFINSKWYLFGNILGFLVSILNAYFMNSRFVFKNKKENAPKKQIIKTYITYTLSLLISLLILYISVEKLGIDEKIAPFIALTVTVPLNFLANKFWIYKEV